MARFYLMTFSCKHCIASNDTVGVRCDEFQRDPQLQIRRSRHEHGYVSVLSCTYMRNQGHLTRFTHAHMHVQESAQITLLLLSAYLMVTCVFWLCVCILVLTRVCILVLTQAASDAGLDGFTFNPKVMPGAF